MKISVVIPTYKRPDLLLRCLRSLEKQDLSKEDFEVLVVSDGYDSVTESAVSTYKKRSELNLVYLHTNGKKGPAAARNTGWKSARGNLIAFTDDDTVPEPGWLSAFVAVHTEQPLAAYTGFTKVPLPEEPTDYALNTFHLQTAQFITANCACTRDALIQVDGLDENFKTAWGEDSDLEFRLLKDGIPIRKVIGAVVVHPVRSNVPWGVSIKEQKKGLYDALLYKKHPNLYRDRIQPKPLWNYYAVILSALLLVVSIIGLNGPLALVSSFCLVFLVFSFFYKRIRFASKEPAHVAEILFTSFVIPFVSVFWRIYGAFKYRVLFF